MKRFLVLAAALLLAAAPAARAQKVETGSAPVLNSTVIEGDTVPVSRPDAPVVVRPAKALSYGSPLVQIRETNVSAGIAPMLPEPTPPPWPDSSKPVPVIEDSESPPSHDASGDMKFQWSRAVKQSLLFLGLQHGYAMTQPKTRTSLRGPFFKDYFRSVKSLHGWNDGGKIFTNYIAHPMQGSFLGFIQVQNDPLGKRERIGASSKYWKSRLKALAWSAAWSTQFEIGPVSQASIGNVGLKGKQTYVDIVMTPTAGLALLVAEDAVDQYIIHRIERFSGNFYIKILTRMLLNPTRTMANVIRFKLPWHRDRGLR